MRLKKKKKIKRRKISMKICIFKPSVPGPHSWYREQALMDAAFPTCPVAPGKEEWEGVRGRIECVSLERGKESTGRTGGETAPTQHLRVRGNTHILTVPPRTSRAPAPEFPLNSGCNPVRTEQWLQLHTCWGWGGRACDRP